MNEYFVMRINIKNRKKGYVSLEVIAMSLIGFTLVLALLSIALNKKILIENEIKTYEKGLGQDDRLSFLGYMLSSINDMGYKGNLDIMEDKKIIQDKLDKLNFLNMKNNKFNLYFSKEDDVFILEEALENNINIYYYDYNVIDKNIYLKERGLYVK